MMWLVTAALGASVALNPGDDIQALTSSLLPGDVVTFNPGTYELYDGLYWSYLAGEEGNPISFRAAAGGEVVLQTRYGGWVAQLVESQHVTLQGLVFTSAAEDLEYTQPSGLYLSNVSDVTVEDCVIRDVWGTGLRIDYNSSNLVVRNNEIHSTGDGSGIYVGTGDASAWMQDSVIEYNLVHDVARNGIYLSPGSQNVTVQHNNIFRAGDTGIALYSTAFGPQNVVYGNVVWLIEDDGIFLEGSALVQNNLVFEIGEDGIQARSNDAGDSLYDVQISHNTVANTEEYGAELEDWFDREDMVFANNVIANPIGYGMYWEDLGYDPYGYYGYTTTAPTDLAETPNYLSANVVTGLVEGFEPSLRVGFLLPGGGIGDFVDVANFDFYPSATSLLRDAGDPSGNAYIPAEDFNGTPRDGATPDVGAYEYDGAEANPGWVIQEGFKELIPSEGPGTTELRNGCCGGSKSDGTAAVLPLSLLLVLAGRRRRG